MTYSESESKRITDKLLRTTLERLQADDLDRLKQRIEELLKE